MKWLLGIGALLAVLYVLHRTALSAQRTEHHHMMRRVRELEHHFRTLADKEPDADVAHAWKEAADQVYALGAHLGSDFEHRQHRDYERSTR